MGEIYEYNVNECKYRHFVEKLNLSERSMSTAEEHCSGLVLCLGHG